MTASSAWSAQSATATAQINVLFKSVTLSTNVLTYGGCSGGYSVGGKLGFPNGRCVTGNVAVTNGAAPTNITIAGTSAIPADGGQQWHLCGGAPPSPPCFGTANAPGLNQFSEHDLRATLALAGTCDWNFHQTPPCGLAQPNQVATEFLSLIGPQSSTDDSPTFTTQITWTAN